MKKEVPSIQIAGTDLQIHSFKGKDGETVIGFIWEFKKGKSAFFSLDRIAKVNNDIVALRDTIQEHSDLAHKAVEKGLDVKFGTITDPNAKEEDKPSDQTSQAGTVGFTTPSKTKEEVKEEVKEETPEPTPESLLAMFD